MILPTISDGANTQRGGVASRAGSDETYKLYDTIVIDIHRPSRSLKLYGLRKEEKEFVGLGSFSLKFGPLVLGFLKTKIKPINLSTSPLNCTPAYIHAIAFCKEQTKVKGTNQIQTIYFPLVVAAQT